MKRLRNIAIYYIILGILLLLTFWFSRLGKLSFIGIALLLLYFVLRYVFKISRFPVNWSETKLILWDLFLYAHPLMLVVFIIWYVYRPFNQTILLPKGYEGIVIIEYGKEDGQPEKRTGSFLGIGGSRIIQTDRNGYVKTQVKYFNKHIPILDVGGPSTDLENMKIYYEDNLNNEIPKYQGPTPDYTNDLYEKFKNNNLPVAYTTHGSTERNIFVVCKVKDYYKYFYTEREIKEINKKGGCYQPDWENKLRIEYINKINQQQICP